MFPSSVAVVAIYVIMQKVGEVFPGIGLGTLAGLFLVYLGGAMGINAWLMKGFFDTIPKDLDESAKVDGATHLQIFRKVILPLAVPILIVVFLISFLGTMNELILAQNLLRGSEGSYTLAVGLSGFVNQGFESRWGPFAAGSLDRGHPGRDRVLLRPALHRFGPHRRCCKGLTPCACCQCTTTDRHATPCPPDRPAIRGVAKRTLQTVPPGGSSDG